MNEVNIPEGWEPCNPSECTQVWVMLAADMLPAFKNLDHDMSVRIKGEWISEQNWPILGIIPIRKAPPPGPIEFVVGEIEFLTTHYTENHGHESPRGYDVIRKPEGVKPGMRFREVVEE